MYFYIAEGGWSKDYIFGKDLSSFEKKKKKKKKPAAIHYFTSGLHWEKYAVNFCVPVAIVESHCVVSRKPRLSFSSFSPCQCFPERVLVAERQAIEKNQARQQSKNKSGWHWRAVDVEVPGGLKAEKS